MLNQAGMCRGKQGNELLIAERPVQKAADQRRQRRPMPCCSSPLPTKRDAAPRVRSALHRRRPRSSRRRMPARQPACSGRPLSCPLSFLLSSLTSLFVQQAEQGSKPYDFQCNGLLLEKRAGEQVEQEYVFLNTFFLSKETYGGHMRGSNQSRSTK